MGDKTIYKIALEKLNFNTHGDDILESVGHIIARYHFPQFRFNKPEGGRGTQDGGYDGYDPVKRAKFACSIQRKYKIKIKQEIDKSIRNADKHVLYFSNQSISEPEKKDLKENNNNINVIIIGVEELSRMIEKTLKEIPCTELYDLLEISSLQNGLKYKRGDIKHLSINNNGEIYKKKIHIQEKNMIIGSKECVSENPLLSYIQNSLKNTSTYNLKHILLGGIGYLGKSFLMQTTYNTLLDEFINETSRSKYKIVPFIRYINLKLYSQHDIKSNITNKLEPLLFFLDGLDELSHTNRVMLNKELQGIIEQNKRVKFIIAGRNSSFIDIDLNDECAKMNLVKFVDYDDRELLNLLKEYKNSPIQPFLTIPLYRNFIKEYRISKNASFDELASSLIRDRLKQDNDKFNFSHNISKQEKPLICIDFLICEISKFCFDLFQRNKYTFTTKELRKQFDENNYLFLINSSIIDYQDEEHISFVSNFYFEYFITNDIIKQLKKKSSIFF